jgi:hypothetical protein
VVPDLSPTAARIGVVSDIHVTPDRDRTGHWNEPIHYNRALARLERALEWFNGEDVDAVFILGDLCEEGDIASLRAALDICQDLTMPGYVLGGNHDALQLELLREEVGARPPLAFADQGVIRGVPFGTAHVTWHGGHRFTATLVMPDGDDLVLVATHFPLISRQRTLEGRGLRYAGDLQDVELHTATLTRRRSPTVVLAAHLHVDDEHVEGRALQLVNPPVVEGEGGASIVSVEPVGIVHREVRALDAGTVRRTTHRFVDGRWT